MYLKPKIEEPFTVAGTVSNKILIFDIDDTLIYSNATIYVVKDGKRIKELTPAEYNDYVWQEGESFDYSNFDSSKLLNSANFTKYWDTLKREYAKGTHIAILTARGKPAMIKKFFLNNGIDIKDDLIFCCAYSKFPWKGPIQYKKTKVIEYLTLLGYNTLVFFDDNLYNLEMAKQLEDLYPSIKIITVHAKIN